VGLGSCDIVCRQCSKGGSCRHRTPDAAGLLERVLSYRRPGCRTSVVTAVLALFLAASIRARVSAQCIGDCNRDRIVTIDEIIALVHIALGGTLVGDCEGDAANHDGPVLIDEILVAENDALNDCSPPLPNVSGTWVEAQLMVASSTCAAPLVDAVAGVLVQQPPCLHHVTATEGDVTATDCNGITAMGHVSATGTMHFTLPAESDSRNGCTVTIETDVTIPADVSPTSAVYDIRVDLRGACRYPSCTIVVEGRWTRM
jgi:hypothetical protein